MEGAVRNVIMGSRDGGMEVGVNPRGVIGLRRVQPHGSAGYPSARSTCGVPWHLDYPALSARRM